MRLFLFLLFITSSIYAQDSNQWNLVSQDSETEVYLLKSNTAISASIQKSAPNKEINWKAIDGQRLLKKIEQNKRNSLSIIGITQWVAENYNWKNLGDKFELVIEGSYLNAAKEKIEFREVHYYTSSKSVQILNTWPKGDSLGKSLALDFAQKVGAQTL